MYRFLALQFPMEHWFPFGKDVGLELAPFGLLVGIGIVVGTIIAGRRARQLGLSEFVISEVSMWAIIPGFIGAHLVHQLVYYPEQLLDDPWLLIKFWQGISSFGGFIGGTLGVLYYFRKRPELPFLPYADAIIYGFTVAWIFGRLGCTTAFDHPGSPTDFFLGMTYYGQAEGLISGPLHGKVIHNLGWYEAIWSVVMAGFFYLQRNKTHVKGWYLYVFVIAYMPFRFMLDFLREVDVRYGLTPGQWFAIPLLIAGVMVMIRANKKQDTITPDGKPKLDYWPAKEAKAYRAQQGR